MGYLDKSTITVDAILTKRGRENLQLEHSTLLNLHLQMTKSTTHYGMKTMVKELISMAKQLKICLW